MEPTFPSLRLYSFSFCCIPLPSSLGPNSWSSDFHPPSWKTRGNWQKRMGWERGENPQERPWVPAGGRTCRKEIMCKAICRCGKARRARYKWFSSSATPCPPLPILFSYGSLRQLTEPFRKKLQYLRCPLCIKEFNKKWQVTRKLTIQVFLRKT